MSITTLISLQFACQSFDFYYLRVGTGKDTAAACKALYRSLLSGSKKVEHGKSISILLLATSFSVSQHISFT